MSTNNPNRNRTQLADRNRMPQKNSGDQHLFLDDESAQNTHKPHRLSRADMQNFAAPNSDQDDQQLS